MNVLITGAVSGIGYDLAKKLVSLGYHVYACCHTTMELERASSREDGIHYLKLDITSTRDYSILSSLHIDVLVNQAGLGIGGSLFDLPISKIEENFSVNVFSTLELSKYFINLCKREGRSGKILITSSLAGYLPIPFMGSYTMTKSSLIIMAKTLREELRLAHLPVQVKLILPGAYHTGFNQQMIDGIGESFNFPDNEKNWCRLHRLFSFVEKRNTSSIVRSMVKAIRSNSSKLVYSAPFFQRIFTRIYRIFSK